MLTHFNKLLKSFCAIIVISIASAGHIYAQLGDIGAFLKAGAEDATMLTKEYLKPFPTGFGTGLNAGWNETAAPKKTMGFSLQIRPSIAVVPGSDQHFDISSLALEKIVIADGEDPVTPTIAGGKGKGPLLEIYENPDNENTKVGEFRMPGGTGISVVPAPIVQAGIGLAKGTDITIRFFPETNIGDYGSFGLLGGAIKHDLTQWLPAGNILPVDISLMAGFNRIGIQADLDVEREGIRNPNDPSLISNPNPDFDNQKVETIFNAFVVNALVGKSLPLISVYGGLGFQTASFDLDIKGDYPVNADFAGQQVYNVLSDPVSFSLKSKSNVHMLGGFRIRLGVLALYGEATLANYFTANAGIGLSFR